MRPGCSSVFSSLEFQTSLGVMVAHSILIADDSGSVRKAMRRHLETIGFRISQAVNGVDAVEQAFSSNPDVVVLDLAVPRMNGLVGPEAASNRSSTQLVLFTSYQEVVDRPEAPQVGIEAVVAKEAW